MLKQLLKKKIKSVDRHFLSGKLLELYRVLRYGRFKSQTDHLKMIGVDISGGCNLSCTMCSLKNRNPQIRNHVLPMQAVERIAPLLCNVQEVSLQVNCEPLLNRDADVFIRQLKKHKSDLFVSMVTNATLMTEPMCEKLIEAGINRILVSLDGATAETYESVRVPAKFEKVTANIRTIARVRDRCQPYNFTLGTITVSNKDNLNELMAILELSADLGADIYHINGLEPYDETHAGKILYGHQSDPIIEKQFQRLRNRAEQLGVQLVMPSLVKRPYDKCDINSCIIDSDGYVFPCSILSYERKYFYEDKELVHPAIVFGNIFQQDLRKIWESEEFTRFRTNIRNGFFPSYCQSCLMQERVICG